MPVDILKVDKSSSRRSAAMSAAIACWRRTIVALGHSLDLEVIAAGVETRGQLAELREMGCEMAQGRLLGEPGGPQPVADALADQREPRPVGSRA
jgi:EAL domain-containing protein (putative c-di-GMP-specific phosphodiesterase class I)